ncbi:ABC transporter ATP-binding protein [Actinocrinis sp.]|uniref:ABC transporter ATP-binding protein n=1 Tax=Actinocrinis sp. TaxID=1920516 RepID=UPI002D4ABF06|nr:ABC transporter ATP-binding protein [Actinocrinis sp.]HZP51764.1 ABC transporter ATP-binding protein [Actinocrinis sp.]
MTEGDTAIRVHGLVKRYGDAVAVDGLDLEVRRGETFALLGPNGAGKTTTTEILEGHRRRDGGRVEVLGQDPQTAGRRWRSRIGIVMQESSDVYELTVGEIVRHFAGYFPRPRPAGEVIDLVGLGGKERSRISTLSGGQRRRLDVALGIVGNPQLLFLDEPTTGFDPEARRQFWELIRALRTAGTTILLTTHYLEEAEQLADRAAVINRGRIVAVDRPDLLGGRNLAAATVGWSDPLDGPRTAETDAPTKLVAELSARYGGEVPDLTVTRPTLEDVYLRLTEGDS